MGAHRFRDLSGRRFGKLQVGNETFIKADSKGRTQRYWSCVCDCGVTKAIRASSLIRGRAKSCSNLRHRQQRFVSLLGHRYGNGRIVVVGYAGTGIDVGINDKSHLKFYRKWRCRCACGKFFITRAASLKSGKTTSCGCVGAEKARRRFSGFASHRKGDGGKH
jgi:hypothetical protein